MIRGENVIIFFLTIRKRDFMKNEFAILEHLTRYHRLETPIWISSFPSAERVDGDITS